MAWGNTGRAAEQHTAVGTTCVITLNSTVAGNAIVVGASSWVGSAHTMTCSDNVNGSYGASVVNATSSNSKASIWIFPNGGGGNLTITLTSSVGSSYIWGGAHEFSGGPSSSPLSGTTGTGTGSTTPASAGTATPVDSDPLFIAVMTYSQANTITENQGGQGFTLSNEYEDTGTSLAQPGSMVFKIAAGAPSAQGHTWALGTAGSWAAVIAAFKPGASTPVYTQTKFRIYSGYSGVGLGEPA